ncbi:AlpA family transcriptional regulator [Chelativorans sp. AA-79]|uniref:helix-turn-helix transcriptional regulator n=1 Tax=Chelativorans sp. AA-79 TaxID=3028735 RepID=UPI0023F78564|nr:AlpA family transcriptional regulator [Chelativorans sp. AA-79]WEX09641.1 AlpA family transcriptional regulator [Chelativorans sp. AA-79]
MPNRLLSLKQVMERIPLSKTEIYRRIRDGRFPRPVRIGSHRIAFAEAEIEEWFADRLNHRDGTPKAGE